MTQQDKQAPRWDLDTLFPGGSSSAEYQEHIQAARSAMDVANDNLNGLPPNLDAESLGAWAEWILELQGLEEKIELARVYALCLASHDVDDSRASGMVTETTGLRSRWMMMRSSLEAFSIHVKDEDWDKLVQRDDLSGVRFYLDEMRTNAREKMTEEKERLALELAVDGYHAWSLHYEKMAGDLRVAVDEDGKSKSISLGQNAARMSNPDRAIRRDAFMKMEEAWQSRADLAAMALNAQAGFRLALYRNRKWGSPLTEPLQYSRLKPDTLDAMWRAISKSGDKLNEFVNAKKQALGIDKFCWYDQEAPVGKADRKFSFGEAGNFVAEHLGSFSEEMGTFVRSAVDQRWIEAEDRSGKRAGAWCSWLPVRNQPRIFMTFSGTYDSLLTLAHELGHGYHGHVLQNEPAFAQQYPMTLAETASIFNELRVTDAALAEIGSPDEKLALLDQKLQASLTFFCNIRARFLFDCRFYAERKRRVIDTDELSDMMQKSQKEAFFGILDEKEGYHPLFWASKLHFFVTEMPFYNYPYTFGFLFAKGVYNRAVEEGKSFAKNYRALLSDSGRMTTEEVAKKHLGVDLTQEDFWDTAVSAALSDVDEFVKLCKK
jgi:pepF/M3 family oligoendopeptidase